MEIGYKDFVHRPIPMRLVNSIGKVMNKLGLFSLEKKTADQLMADACRRTGLSDWGDESFREPLEVLLESYRTDAGLNFFGWYIIHQRLTSCLANRLLIQEEIKQHPEIVEGEIPQPLFIVNMPRTGSTLLQRLLAQDPSNRSMLFWETLSSSPPPEPETYDTDPRIERAEKFLKIQEKIMPLFLKMHEMGPKIPEECVFLLENSLKSVTFTLGNHLPSYLNWLNKQDMVSTYQYHKLQLQILQSRLSTSRWVCKAPTHLYSMKALLSVYPDACIVQTHRDPCTVLPSVCCLVAAVRGATSDCLDLGNFGEEQLHRWELFINRCLQARDESDSSRFFDIHYRELVEDPIGTVKKLYNHFGYKYEHAFEKGMKQWLDSNPKHKKGAYHYSLELFEMDRDEVSRTFEHYCKQFGIPKD